MAASASSDLIAQRDLNCLSDENRQTRKRALSKLGSLPGAGHAPEVLAPLWADTLQAPVLKLFADQVEKNRELAITLAADMLAALPDAALADSLMHVIPAVTARIGGTPVAEGAEELRLQLLQMIQALVPRCAAALSVHLPELVQILVASFADAFPDAKKEGCAIATALASAAPANIEAHCATLIAGLAPALAHQHSRVRSMATEAMFALLVHAPSVLPEVGPQLSLIAVDRAPAVREQAVHALATLLARLPQRRQHAARLLPLLLCALSDEVESIQKQARLALNRLGDLFAVEEAPPPKLMDISDDLATAAEAAASLEEPVPMQVDTVAKSAAATAAAAAAAAATGRVAPAVLLGTMFAEAPHPPTAALVASELKALLLPLLAELGDWTVKTRQRSASTLLGIVWHAGPACTDHLEQLLPPLMKSINDDNEDVQKTVHRVVSLLGEACSPAVYVPLLLTQLHSADPDAGSDTSIIAKRGMCLTVLSALVAGAEPSALSPQLASLGEAVAQPTFCMPPPGLDDDRSATYTGTQLRLCDFLRSLISRAGADCAADPPCFSLYCALMRLAAVPSTAGRGFQAQRVALEVVASLAAAAGKPSAAELHAEHMPRLVLLLVGDGTAPPSTALYANWKAETPDWHLLQALLRQCDGATAAGQLIYVLPALTRVLDPKQEPVLRGTALSLVDSLLASPSFCAAEDLHDWAEDLLAALLVPNLVWRAGRAAEHVRLAAMTGVNRLLPLPALKSSQLASQLEELMPVLTSCLDDDNVETRRISCSVTNSLLRKLGKGGLPEDRTRKLYPELLKRLDDASDEVRLQACAPICAFFETLDYSAIWSQAATFDKANYQYLLRGLVVHLDDPSLDIQEAIFRVLEVGLEVDPPVFATELIAVRERHRSPKLCDKLVEQARAHGQLV